MAELALTRRQVFEPMLAYAKSRLASMATARKLSLDDSEFLARAMFDLESDGVAIFNPEQRADEQFYRDVRSYLAARVGDGPVETLGIDTDGVEQLAESATPAELAEKRAFLDRILIQLVTHTEVAT